MILREPLVLSTGQTVTTDLTPHVKAVTDATFDLNNSTWVKFEDSSNIQYWQVLVSVASYKVTLLSDIKGPSFTLVKGLTVTLSAQGRTQFTVFLNGTIYDSVKKYPMRGKSLGTFMRTDALRKNIAGAQALEAAVHRG